MYNIYSSKIYLPSFRLQSPLAVVICPQNSNIGINDKTIIMLTMAWFSAYFPSDFTDAALLIFVSI